ncbi:MAG: sugar ABC transporter substrate-binding protein [Actinobacteria bacterium]|nr:MAG: sugar ABC transporter substrate-binding protein [Actinomycetota bacterium]
MLALAVVLTACSKKTSTSTSPSQSPTAVPTVTATSFTSDFSAMSQLTGLAASGKGNIAVLLPGTASSARYVAFDQPLLTQAFQKAGLSASQFTIDNAQGSESTQLTQAQALITGGASVLLVDALSSGGGANIETYAKQHGVKTIDYDRLVLGGSRDAYVSFDNVKVGGLIGQGAVDCVTAWNVAKPAVFELDGSPTDNNATLFAQGYNTVLKTHFDDGSYTKVGEQAVPAWNNDTAQTIFTQQYTAHKNINAVVSANDGLGNSVINVLKNNKIAAKTVPVTGQDATLQGMQNVLSGYQCGSVYKPIFLETQAAAALAIYLRASQTPPAALLNGKTTDTGVTPNVDVPSVLLTPVWVTTANMGSTVVADKFVDKAQLCAGAFAAMCTSAGIS